MTSADPARERRRGLRRPSARARRAAGHADLARRSDDDPELAAFGHSASVVVLDADVPPRRCTRSAIAFASTHPDVPVLLATTNPAAATLAGLPLLGKASTDALLRAVGRVGNGHDRLTSFNF
jgi:hypothetical protein